MKKINLLIALLLVIILNINAQNLPLDSIVRDSNGNPLYYLNEMIVKFSPDLVKQSVINNKETQTGIVSDFINSLALQILIDIGYFNQEIANLKIKKIHHNMTTNETQTVTRIGESMEIPKFWSTFLIEWKSDAGMSYENALDTLNKLWPIIEYAHPNYIYQLSVLPNDPSFTNGGQAGLHPTPIYSNCNINIDPAWDLTVGSNNIKVGVYDTGINWDHEDYSENNSGNWVNSRIKGGYDWKNSVSVSSSTTMDADGHGSACAGIIGAIRNNDLGVAGIAGGNGVNSNFGTHLYAMKIAQGSKTFIGEDLIADAITEGATSTNGSYGYSLNVMNHSWGGPNMGNTLKDAIRYSFQNKVVLSVASGNTGNNDKDYPASAKDEWVMKVGANNTNGSWAGFSTYGNNLDFIAPGVKEIYETTDAATNNTYNYNNDGTSFAAPHAAGVAALMLSYINAPSNAPNNLASEDVENLLQKFSTDVGVTGYDDYTGFGRINAGATLQGIRWPRFEVKHYSTMVANSSNTKVQSNIRLIMLNSHDGLVAGTYIGDVYRINATLNITQPTGRTIIDVWNRSSSSTLWSGANPMVTEVNAPIATWNQTSATMNGFIFNIKTTLTGANVNRWFPNNLSGSSNFALTVYSDDPNATGINTNAIDEKFARIIPNPSNGDFTMMFTLLKPTEMAIEVSDITGKIVYNQPMRFFEDGHQEIKLSLQNLNNGIYFCNLRTVDGVITKKLSIIK